MKPVLSRRLALCALAASALAGPGAQAQSYPSKPVTLVVGFAPGGSADILARLVAQKLAPRLGQSVIVENRPGAGGTIAAAAVAAAPGDGHTLLLVSSGHAGSGALYPKLSYDPLRSFAPVVKVGGTPVVIVAPAAGPFHSLQDVLAQARRQPGRLNYAAGGGGATVTALAAEYVKSAASVYMVGIPYKGSGPALTALLAGEVDLGFEIPTSALPHLRSGKLRALAVTSRSRSAVLPDVPTVAEQGLTNFDVVGWFGLMAPAATPPAVVSRLNQEVRTLLEAPDVKEKLAALGVEAGGGTPEAFAQLVRTDTQRAGEAIRRMGVKVE